MHVPAKHFIGRVTQHFRTRFVDENTTAFQVDSINALASGIEQQFKLPSPGCVVRKFGKMLEHGGAFEVDSTSN
jgi:hypothetical protein